MPDAAIMKSSDCFQRNAVAASAVMDERAVDGKEMETPDTRKQDEPCASLVNAPPLGDVAAPVAAASSELGYPPGQPLPALSEVPAAVLTEDDKETKLFFDLVTYWGNHNPANNPAYYGDRDFAVNLRSFTILKTELPPLSRLSRLVTLSLEYCGRLTRLPETLGDLVTLRTMFLSHCWELTSLPESLGQLTRLEILKLENCFELKRLPASLGRLTSLQKLTISFATRLTCLPQSLGDLEKLKVLELELCVAVTCLPDTLGNLVSLQTLHLLLFEKLTCLPESLGRLAALQHLNLTNCHSLSSFPSSFGWLTALKTLSLTGCPLGDWPVPGHVWNIWNRSGSLAVSCNYGRIVWCTNLRLLVLTLVLAARRRRKTGLPRLPPELYELVFNEFLLSS